jgi:hypothetical protein
MVVETHKTQIENIIQQLKDIEVDGETMEYIITEVSMNKQLLHQLLMKCDQSEIVVLMDDWYDTQGMSFF